MKKKYASSVNAPLSEVFEYFDADTLKNYLSKISYYNYKIPKNKFTITEFKSVNLEDRFWKFIFLDKKDIEAFKLIPSMDRYKAFRYLDNRSVEAFKLIPIDD